VCVCVCVRVCITFDAQSTLCVCVRARGLSAASGPSTYPASRDFKGHVGGVRSAIGVTRLGSPASPRIVPVDGSVTGSSSAACRAYRDPRTRNHSQVLTRVPGPPTGVTRLGSPASPRIVPADAAACRACRDPRARTPFQVLRERSCGVPPPAPY
jgi:hypothetical protein